MVFVFFFICSDFFHHIKTRKFWDHKPPNTSTEEYVYSPFRITSCVMLKFCTLIWVVSASKVDSHYTWLICWEQTCSRHYQTSEASSLVSASQKFLLSQCVYSVSYMACLNQSCAITLLKNLTNSAKSADSWAGTAWLRLATQDTAFRAWTAELLTDQLLKYCRLQHGIWVLMYSHTPALLWQFSPLIANVYMQSLLSTGRYALLSPPS